MYQDFLERNPTPAALEYWTKQLVAGSCSRAAFLVHLALSDEWFRVQIRDLYHLTLQRDPSPAALGQRADQLNTGRLTPRTLEALLYASDEYLTRNHLTTEQWVSQLYADYVGWIPTPAQLDRWVTAAAAHGRAYVAEAFLTSPHAIEAAVARLYQLVLHRSPIGASLAHWEKVDLRFGDLAVEINLAATQEAYDKAMPTAA
jgi:hypothetical protein